MIKLSRLIKSFQYAIRGLIKVFREEQNLRVQIIFACFVSILAWYCHIKLIEWCILIILIGLVLLMEIVNSAIERVTDVLKPRIHTYVKEVKDIMAAAVMLASGLAVAVGIIIFFPYLFK